MVDSFEESLRERTPGLFPNPIPDESDYSLLCRYHALTGNSTLHETKIEILGAATPAYITHDDSVDLITFIAWNLCLDYYEVAELFSLRKYWRWVYTNYNSLLRTYHAQLRSQKCCAICMKEDVTNYGVTCWHRSHQPPGVVVCHKHGGFLYRQTCLNRQRSYLRMPKFSTIKRENLLQKSSFSEEIEMSSKLMDKPKSYQGLSYRQYATVVHEILNNI